MKDQFKLTIKFFYESHTQKALIPQLSRPLGKDHLENPQLGYI